MKTSTKAAIFGFTLGAVGWISTWASGAFYGMLTEPLPYRNIHIVSVGPYQRGSGLEVEVQSRLFRTKLCPYILERTVLDANANKRHDFRKPLSAPKTLGLVERGFPFLLDSEPDAGTAIYIYAVRLGAMCNPVQHIFPNWTQWFEVEFEVTDGPSPALR